MGDSTTPEQYDWDSSELAKIFESREFRWHQRFKSVGEYSPGQSKTEEIFERSIIADSLSNQQVIDIGTTNGFSSFLCERRGADVVATDIADIGFFGFEEIRAALGSRARFVQVSVMEMLDVFEPKSFDITLFWGVFYHLRHPLAALEILTQLSRKFISIETVVLDSEEPVMLFCEGSAFAGDGSNWWIPTESFLVAALSDLGVQVENLSTHFDGRFGRTLVEGTVSTAPLMLTHGYEPLVRSIRYDSQPPQRKA